MTTNTNPTTDSMIPCPMTVRVKEVLGAIRNYEKETGSIIDVARVLNKHGDECLFHYAKRLIGQKPFDVALALSSNEKDREMLFDVLKVIHKPQYVPKC